jgi:hypothetical protein
MISVSKVSAFEKRRGKMNTKLIAIAAAFGIVFALASTSFADDRAPATSRAGTLNSGKIKSSTPLRTAPAPAPEAQGGTLEEVKGKIIYF